MTNLKLLFKRPLRAVPNNIIIGALIVALIGFADAVYLTLERYQGVIPPCSITGGCEAVLTSAYATIAGIPVSLLGVLFYLVILIGLFAYLESKNTKILKWTLFLTAFGFLSSLWFVFLQAFVIHAYCAYCLFSALTSTVLFICALVVFSKYSTPDTLPE